MTTVTKKSAPVQISGEMHTLVTYVAQQRTQAEGQRVTIRQVIEDAIRAHYHSAIVSMGVEAGFGALLRVDLSQHLPQPQQPVARPTQTQEPEPEPVAAAMPMPANPAAQREFDMTLHGEAVFAALISAAFTGTSPAEQTAAISKLGDFTIPGSFGQRIKARDLAYHLRSTEAPISTLGELIADYEGGGAEALASELG